MKRAFALCCLVLLTAAERPRPGERDPHVQSITWSPDQVVRLTGALGWQILIEFAPDERIETVSIGDALAWQVTPNKKARNLFLKPLRSAAATNMTVVTDQRRYTFDLSTGPRNRLSPWVVRFDYPRPVLVTVPEPAPPPPPRLNFAYALAGDSSLLPQRVWDDGQQTFFEFAPETSIPAIFAGGPGKDETLVNSIVRGRVMIVQQTAGRFTLRTGKRTATVSYAPGVKS